MRADLIINNNLIVELKSTKTINNIMKQQTINYLKLTGIKEGLLINFPQSPASSCEIAEVNTSEEVI